ncbi:hypothetical protein MHM98_10765 [Psychrobium sp. MM17-31]|uniref:PKD domain-containing protein n=1 Tax=Psychrobium sp. MM17-31 TaxID=2917758 RepID=UPI001EF64FD6|nr:hypothetical protein [Psychrobium sp. MM17-31]MCG7531818.1 hypothetical protein [Psychrobium sp. MM17-31]
MKALVVLAGCLLLIGCGGGSSKTEQPDTPIKVENRPPVVEVITDITIASGATYQPSPVVSDPDGDSVTFAWLANNDGITVDDSSTKSPVFTFPIRETEESYMLTLKVDDTKGGVVEKQVAVNVRANVIVSSSPVIGDIPKQTVESKQTIILKPQVSDLDGDIESYHWTSSDADVTFSDENILSPTISFPETDSVKEITLYLSVVDSKGNETNADVAIELSPKSVRELPALPAITITDSAAGSVGDVIDVEAKIITTETLISGKWTFDEQDYAIAQFEEIGNNQYSVKLSLSLPDVSQFSKLPLSIQVTTESEQQSTSDTIVLVSPVIAPSLKITLDESISIDELASKTVETQIDNSHPIEKIVWQWLDDTEMTLNDDAIAQPTISTPQVNRDEQARLQITVHMKGLVETAQVVVSVKNSINQSPIVLKQSRLVAARGQEVRFSIESDDMAQIKSATWKVNGADVDHAGTDKSALNLTIDDIEASSITSVAYTAILQDDSTVIKTANLSILNDAAVRAAIQINLPPQQPIIKNDMPYFMRMVVVDQFGLIDSVEVTQPFTVNTFSPIEIKSAANLIQLSLLTNTIEFDHIDFLNLRLSIGDVVIDQPLQLTMEADQ